jgi:DNA-damage-inducible protein D
MTEAELIFTALAELSRRQIAENRNATGLPENAIAAKVAGSITRQARQQLENETGQSVLSNSNYLPPQTSALNKPHNLLRKSASKPKP